MKKGLFALLALLAPAPFAAAALEEMLPVESPAVLKIKSFPNSAKNLRENPAFAYFHSEKFTKFLALEETGKKPSYIEGQKKLAEALAAFSGECVIAYVNTPKPDEGYTNDDLVFLAETKLSESEITELLVKIEAFQPVEARKRLPANRDEEAKIEDVPHGVKINGAFFPSLEAEAEPYAGSTLHNIGFTDESGKKGLVSSWSLTDGVFICTTAPNVVRELVDARKKARDRSYSDSSVYKANKAALDDSEVWLLADVPLLSVKLRELIKEKTDDENPSPVDPLAAYDTISLGSVSHIRYSLKFAAGEESASGSVAWTEKRGIAKLIAEIFPKNAKPTLALLPSGIVTGSVSAFDMNAFLSNLESLIKEAAPLAKPIIDAQIAKAKKNGLDLRDGLLSNFGSNFWSCSAAATSATDGKKAIATEQVFVVDLKDGKKIDTLINNALVAAKSVEKGIEEETLFDTREIQGIKVRSLKKDDGVAAQFAIHKDKFFGAIGKGTLFDRVLAQFENPKNGLDTAPEIIEGLKKLPAEPCSISYLNMGSYAEMLFAVFQPLFSNLKAMNQAEDEPEIKRFDPQYGPKAVDFPFSVLGVSNVGENEITSTAIIIRKADANR